MKTISKYMQAIHKNPCNSLYVLDNGLSKFQLDGLCDCTQDNLVVPGKSSLQQVPWLLSFLQNITSNWNLIVSIP